MNEKEQKLIEEWLHTNPYIPLGEYCLQKGREEVIEILYRIDSQVAKMVEDALTK